MFILTFIFLFVCQELIGKIIKIKLWKQISLFLQLLKLLFHQNKAAVFSFLVVYVEELFVFK